jgi:3-oxoacyl-[acyl-carrier-protein] synthase-3
MTRQGALLSGARYVLGEEEVPYTEIPGLPERAREFRMAMNPRLWGWGTVRRTSRSLADLAVESGRTTLELAGADPGAVDELILCSTEFPGSAREHGSFVEQITSGLGLPGTAFTGLTLNRCTNLLAAIDVASALVTAQRRRTVLVITTDKARDERDRTENFALFSDGAASCLISGQGYGSPTYEVTACACAQRNGDLDWSHEISSDLARAVNEELLKPRGLELAGLEALMPANILAPLLMAKERQAGFSPGQLDTGNVPRIGHCFAADPLINLVDRAAAGRVRNGGRYLLAVSLPGTRYGVLLRACG